MFNGAVMREVSNDGTDNKTFAATVAEGRAVEPTSTTTSPAGPFRNGQVSGSAHASFDRHYDAITLAVGLALSEELKRNLSRGHWPVCLPQHIHAAKAA